MIKNDGGDADHPIIGQSKNADTFAQIWDEVSADAIENLNWHVSTSVIDAIDSVMSRMNAATAPVHRDLEHEVREMAEDVIDRIMMRADQEFEMMRMIHGSACGSFGQPKFDLDRRLFRPS